MLVIQLQSPYKSLLQFGKEMKRAAQKCHMSADRFTACKSGDSLIDYCLENRCGKVFLGGTVIDQRLDVCFGKNTAAGSDRIKGFVILCIFIQSGCIALKKRCHLINKRTCSSGTDTVHSLFNITTLKVDDFGIFASKLNGDVSKGCKFLKGRGNSDYLLDKRNTQVICQCKAA